MRKGRRVFALFGGVPAGLTGRRIILGIRPEHMQIGTRAVDKPFDIKVTTTEPTGTETLVMARFGRSDL